MKSWRWRRYGMKLELAVASWLVNDYGWRDILWDTIGKIDVTVLGLKTEIECKRLNLTQFVTKGWLKEHVVDRYSEDAWLKVLVVTKKCWGADEDKFLVDNGVKTIVVGSIDTAKEMRRARRVFLEEFTKLFIGRLREEMLEVNGCRERLSR
jgi:hypothetical protein